MGWGGGRMKEQEVGVNMQTKSKITMEMKEGRKVGYKN